MKRKTAREYYPENEVFEESKKDIARTFGLKLSLIEQAALRRSIGPILDRRDKIEDILSGYNSFDPVEEAITCFMTDYYGLTPELAMVTTSTGKGTELYVHHPKEFNEYLKIIQERAHYP